MSLVCRYSACGRTFAHPKGRGRYTSYCSEAHKKAGRAEIRQQRQRSYERCSQCGKVAELAWGRKEYCSALCFGIAAGIAKGLPEELAQAQVMAAIAQNPHLATKRPPKVGKDRETNGFTDHDIEVLNSHEFGEDGFLTFRQESYLGGVRGPDEGRTCPEISSGDPVEHRWYLVLREPDWWK